ncbi:carboxylesterase/lipase family protein [Candidatus Pantoea multigeneris]|uniref:Carboxylic ester hydrolase n=1 Tax=Candidatus Pantoea multigeneris TaxID=2608357 RepID=A0ABX0RFL7_9GAMM|nr:carboxylesterase/lipase family protein [Pantoea multigeneris]NIF22030.1 carboxylesterase/lipase family protein [Pantoea multigeneris]
MKNQQRLNITTVEGELSGVIEGGSFVFRGIPYAAPPVGPLRWRAPQRLAPWAEPRDATRFAPGALQSRQMCIDAAGGDPGTLSEDCLYLNVWTPDPEPMRPLPVMVWLHGGGFRIGAGHLPPYDGQALAQRGAVVVTLNYRLGHLGFFAHPALDAEQGEVPVTNFALLDQLAALQWVQRNIQAFGGDRDNVTLFGESAGAQSTLALCCSPLATGLFHKAIVQSAYALPEASGDKLRSIGLKVAQHLGLSADASMDQLRAIPAEAFWPLDRRYTHGPVPVWGDSVLPQPILKTFLRGKQLRIPLMIGSTSDEASVLDFFGTSPHKMLSSLIPEKHLGWRVLRWMYDIHDTIRLSREATRDIAFTLMPWMLAHAQHSIGMPCWRYWFDYVSENTRDISPNGTWHGSDVPYVFHTLGVLSWLDAARPATAEDAEFADRVCDYWFNFARYTSEYSHVIEGSCPWPLWRPGQDITLSLGCKGQGQILLKHNFMRSRLRVFRLVAAHLARKPRRRR